MTRLLLIIGLVNCLASVQAQDGFCMVNGATTGGAGGPTVTVTNGTDFNAQININGPRIIQVQGVLSIGRVKTKGDKTIIGLGANATLLGNINVSDTSNVIIRNLRITGPANDGLTIWNARHVWVDHCTFYDTGDGLCDMNRGSQYVTVSWCKFHYVNQVEHRFTMIADGYDNGAGSTNWGYYTLHHNWWSTRCDQRMAASSYGRLHYYNNYFNCTNNYYSSNARNETEINSENNYYAGVHNPISVSSGTSGKIRTSGNIYAGCSGTIHPGTDSVFTPPYSYSLDPAANVSAIVMANAGAPGSDTIPIPPKIWNGGGSDNNLSGANNWALNETPKVDDVLIFAGNTRLAPNNNIAANTEFYGIAFSNNAGAFVFSGNSFNLGGPIIDDSSAVQTINANIDFAFGQFHYGTNRVFDISSSEGSLIINGDIAGASNPYFNSYSVTKRGDGLLVLNGKNTFVGSLQLDGGMVQFKTLDTNQPGSLGSGDVLNFNGGGVRWASGNASDISTRKIAIQSGGATLDSGSNDISLAFPIGGNGSGGLTKIGAGKIVLNGNNAYSGITRVAGGVLGLGTSGALPNSSSILISNGATLDVSERLDGTLTLSNKKTLTGCGHVFGSVTAGNGATIAPGCSIGALTFTGALTLQSGSTTVMETSADAHANDFINALEEVHYGGTLIVTNVEGAFAAGDSFKLFDAGACHGSFNNIVWPPLSPGLLWTNQLTQNGSIAVVRIIDTTPVGITSTLTGNALHLSWPADHIGWHLEMQTSDLETGLSTGWIAAR